MNVIRYFLGNLNRYFVFSFTSGDMTGEIDIITEMDEFPSRKKVEYMIMDRLSRNNEYRNVPIVINNIFEFENEEDYKNWKS